MVTTMFGGSWLDRQVVEVTGEVHSFSGIIV